MRRQVASATLDLLLLTRSLIDQAHGPKKAALQRAWIRSFNSEAAEMLDLDEGRLPQSPRAAVEALLRLALQLGKSEGISGPDLCQLFNDIADSGALIAPTDADAAVRRGFALLGVLAAHHMTAKTPPEYDDAQEVA